MFSLFKTRAEAVGSEVYRFGTKSEARKFIEEFLKKEEIKDIPGSYAVWADCPILKDVETIKMAEKIPGLRFNVTRKLAKEAKIGITQMAWGIANTGTVVQESSAVEQRLASALVWIHVALLNTNKIVADLMALTSNMHPRASDYIALITGPSRTADIERVLAIGVHGPERLVIVCIDEAGGITS
ncbi:MAG TPA: lactate utilization protein [Nitrospirota bacterium]|nr:lactate utilization protein [Nitrospirota bacterium]